MSNLTFSEAVGSLTAVMVTIFFVTVACVPTPPPTNTSIPPPTSSPEKAAGAATPDDRWSELVQRTPYPYSAPLPAAEPTILDGTYAKVDPRQAEHVPCKRCPAYPPGGGVWKLNLDKGIFRVYHELTGWVTIGSFTVTGDQRGSHYQSLANPTWL